MFCPNCGNQLQDNAKFCNSCGFKIVLEDTTSQVNNVQNSNHQALTTQNINNQVQDSSHPKPQNKNKQVNAHQANNHQTQKPQKKSKKLLIAVIIVAAVIVALVAGLLVYLFVFSNNNASNTTVIEQKDNNNDPRMQKFNEVINQYEQSLAWYKSNKFYTDNSYSRAANEGIEAFINDMQRCYSYFAKFSNVPEKYTFEDVDNDGNNELIVQDKAGTIATYFYNDKSNSITFSNVGDSKNTTTKDKLKNSNPKWETLNAADMHIKLSGTLKIQDTKERAKDPNAKCQVFEYNGDQERKQMLDNQYFDANEKYVIIDLDEKQNLPVQQLVAVFPHNIWSIILAYNKSEGHQPGHEKDFDTFSNYNGKHVQINIDLTECNAPSGVTGYGNDINIYVDSKCICGE